MLSVPRLYGKMMCRNLTQIGIDTDSDQVWYNRHLRQSSQLYLVIMTIVILL